MRRAALLLTATLLVAACGEKPAEKKGAPPTLITTTLAKTVALEVSERLTATRWDTFKTTWRASWTPGRIVAAGLASGFLVGRAQPMKLAGSGGVLNLATALAGIFAGTGAQAAAKQAEDAASAAEGAAVAAATDSPPSQPPPPAQFAAGMDHDA